MLQLIKNIIAQINQSSLQEFHNQEIKEMLRREYKHDWEYQYEMYLKEQQEKSPKIF